MNKKLTKMQTSITIVNTIIQHIYYADTGAI